MDKTMLTRMLKVARAAARNSYSPFSDFKVGAAVLADDGRVYAGANVENSSFGLTVCAERVAIFKAVSAGEHEIKAVAVFAESPNSQLATRDSSLASLTPPCGACLQVISEFAENPEIVLSNGRTTKTYHLKELLPLGFRL